MDKQLGKVNSVMFGKEDHGIMTLYLMLDYGGSGQGFGGYALDEWDENKQRRVGTAAGMDFIIRILDLFGVNKLEDVVGRPVYGLFKDKMTFGQLLIGLETPKFDGGKQFLVEDWRKEWGYDKEE